jgi:hypothetical protein
VTRHVTLETEHVEFYAISLLRHNVHPPPPPKKVGEGIHQNRTQHTTNQIYHYTITIKFLYHDNIIDILLKLLNLLF